MVGTPKRLERFLMSGEEAQKPANLVKLFEQIKGRKATAREVARFERALTVGKKVPRIIRSASKH
jgi:hypothetical protein